MNFGVPILANDTEITLECSTSMSVVGFLDSLVKTLVSYIEGLKVGWGTYTLPFSASLNPSSLTDFSAFSTFLSIVS